MYFYLSRRFQSHPWQNQIKPEGTGVNMVFHGEDELSDASRDFKYHLEFLKL